MLFQSRFIPLLVGQITATWLLAYAHGRSGRGAWLYVGLVLARARLAHYRAPVARRLEADIARILNATPARAK